MSDVKMVAKCKYVQRLLKRVDPNAAIERYDVHGEYDRFFFSVPATPKVLQWCNKHNPEPNIIVFGEQVIPMRNAEFGVTTDVNVVKVMVHVERASTNPFSFTPVQTRVIQVLFLYYLLLCYLFYYFFLRLLWE
jgi:hypothetical protein